MFYILGVLDIANNRSRVESPSHMLRGRAMSGPEFDVQKFKELILHIAKKCEGDRFYGATKLNKILFYSDFLAYKLFGKPITGADYFALPRGPAPRFLVPIKEEMTSDNDIVENRQYSQHRIIALRDPNYDAFSAKEIALVDGLIDVLRETDAKFVSELSHLFLGWQAAMAEGQKTDEHVSIPYETVFVKNPAMDEYEDAYGLELAKKHGWFT